MPPSTLPQPSEPYRSLIAEWARSLRSENKSDRTVRGYTDSARWFHLWCEHPTAPTNADDPDTWLAAIPTAPGEPADVQPGHIRSWISYRLDTTSPGNANNNYRALQAWFNWLVDEEEIDSHPMAKLKPPNVPDQPPPIVPDDLMQKVLDTCAGRDFISIRDTAIIRLFFDTGARLSEIGNLALDELDLDVDVIQVLGKGGRRRAVPFSPKTGKALSRYLRARAKHSHAHLDALWLAERQRGALKPNGIKLMFRRRGEQAGVNDAIGRNLHAHLGRHFVAHHAQAEGMGEGDLMLIMGWKSPEMARRYGRSAATERAHAKARKLRIGDRL